MVLCFTHDTLHLQQLKGMQSSKLCMCKGFLARRYTKFERGIRTFSIQNVYKRARG